MAVKHLVVPGFTGGIKYAVTRGLAVTQNVTPLLVDSNILVGDAATEDTYRKGVALTGLAFAMVNKSDGTPITSGSVTTRIVKDGGSQTATTNTAAHKGNGSWAITLTADEMDADIVALTMTHTNAMNRYVTLRTSS